MFSGMEVFIDNLIRISIDTPFKISIDRAIAASIDTSSRKLYGQVHAPQYQKQQGTNIALFKSCMLRTLNLQRKMQRIERQHHPFVDQHSPSTVDRDYSSGDCHYPPDIDRKSTSDIDRY
ncbi:hypothetical protein F2Q70_00022257 [Brassica cretica]|uniref:Uncharacterized protein n=1 Tax=Brassica cretica TaxID=69181 RepID=A0A8S9GMB7_BRACR|nr:hypothetical protein F2Q70_00022257 [Brassica cretica]